MKTLRVDAVLFDLDGTLVDESESYREAIRRTAEFLLAAPVSRDEVEEIKALPGFNNDWDATWALVGRRLHGMTIPPGEADRGSYAYRHMVDVFQSFYLGDRLWEELSGHEAPVSWPEPLMARETLLVALEVLERLSRFRMGIATSRPRSEALLALRQHGLDRFFLEEAVVAMQDAAAEKPHPAPLRALIERLQVQAPVYVGDSVNDALAAEAAGVPFVHVGNQALPHEVERCVFCRIERVADLLDLLQIPEEAR